MPLLSFSAYTYNYDAFHWSAIHVLGLIRCHIVGRHIVFNSLLKYVLSLLKYTLSIGGSS